MGTYWLGGWESIYFYVCLPFVYVPVFIRHQRLQFCHLAFTQQNALFCGAFLFLSPMFTLLPLLLFLLPSLPSGLGIHAVVTYFIVDKMGGNFKLLIDQYILKLVPKPIMDQVEAKLK